MKKRYWSVPAIADEQGIRPKLPEGVNWAGNTDGEVYVIVTNEDLSGVPGVKELTDEEAARAVARITDLPGDDVEQWRAG